MLDLVLAEVTAWRGRGRLGCTYITQTAIDRSLLPFIAQLCLWAALVDVNALYIFSAHFKISLFINYVFIFNPFRHFFFHLIIKLRHFNFLHLFYYYTLFATIFSHFKKNNEMANLSYLKYGVNVSTINYKKILKHFSTH